MQMLKLVSKVSFLCISQDCFFFILLSQYLVNKGVTISQISFLLMIKKISQIITEIPFGFFFERFNPKILFILSRIFKIISMIILFHFTQISYLIFASIIGGLATASLFSKIDVYIYNSLEEKKELHFFPKIVAAYYAITDFLMIWMYYVSGVLVENISYYSILIISILFVSLSFPIILTIDNKKFKDINAVKENNIFYLKNKLLQIKKEISKKEILLSIILLGFLNGFIWEIVSITNLVLKYNQQFIPFISDGNIAKISSMLFLFMSIGSFIAIFIKNFDIKKGLKIIFLLFFTMPFATLNVKTYLFQISICMFFYTFCQICIERFIDNKISRNIRATCFSLISIILVISQIFGYGIFSIISKIYNPNYGITILSIICMIFLSILILALLNQLRNKIS